MSAQAWPPRCAVCHRSIAHLAVDAKTCCNAHRQKLYRQNKRQREDEERRRVDVIARVVAVGRELALGEEAEAILHNLEAGLAELIERAA